MISALLFFGSIGGYFMLPKGAIDSSSAEAIMVTLEYPSDTPTDKVLAEGEKLEAFLVDQPEKKWVYMSAGNSEDGAKWGQVSAPTLVTYQIGMNKGEDAEAMIERIKEKRSEYPGAELNASAMNFFSASSGSDIYIDVAGEDPAQLAAAAEQITGKITGIEGVLKVKTNQEQKRPVYMFEVDAQKAKAEDVAMQLQGMLNPMPIGSLNNGTAATAVMLQPIVTPQTEADLEKLTIMTEAGAVPVSSVAKLVRTEEPSMYFHKDGQTYIRITATAESSKLSVVGAEIDKVMKDIKLPEGVDQLTGGASAQQADDFAELGVTMLVSIMIVYLIMVITFRTLRAPLAILVSLPLAAIGAVLGLMITGISPDFTAAFGALMLIGIVVTNAIVLVDRIKQNEQRMTIREAILDASGTRMRPILMTAIATICAMLPLLFGTTESGSIVSQSLAIVVIGGLAVATLLTLVIVPCVYEAFYFLKSRKERRQAEAASIAA
ncbi:efflux RND transporter permease subunit [uncultured Paenibacillus sp.]|uniref:efflux RND transporter permease subunit n=1 Tax=uncultured Paenibacillus sp. TaxID=227322 RepID=UPI0028D1C9E2|nr:efflux RND transporter permease subunit [uncultured Paenibacillus sp.]